MATRRREVTTVRLSVDVDEETWRKLRREAEQEREGPAGGPASMRCCSESSRPT
jgi:hypothetical protein